MNEKLNNNISNLVEEQPSYNGEISNNQKKHNIKKIVLLSILFIAIISIAIVLILKINNNSNLTDKPLVNDENETLEEDDTVSKRNSYILGLKPTHDITSEYPFIGWKKWSVGHEFSDLSHLNKGYYYFHVESDNNEVFEGSWEELKDLPVESVSVNSNTRKIYVQYINDETNKESFAITYNLDENISNMTIQEAIEEGYWNYEESTTTKFFYTKFFEEEPEGEYVEEIINVWGMPSEVSYTLYEDQFVWFSLKYKTKDYTVHLIGNEYLECDEECMNIQSIVVLGNKTQLDLTLLHTEVLN